MKKLLSLFVLFLFVGCAGMQQELASPLPNNEKSAGVGDVFFTYEMKTFPVENNERFDLTVVELDGNKIGLQYAEYFYSSGIGPYWQGAGWKIKDGFNKRFDYSISDKTVRFRGYEFEIVSLEGGQVRYRRIK